MVSLRRVALVMVPLDSNRTVTKTGQEWGFHQNTLYACRESPNIYNRIAVPNPGKLLVHCDGEGMLGQESSS